MEQTIGFGDKASNERIGDGAATELIWAGEEREKLRWGGWDWGIGLEERLWMDLAGRELEQEGIGGEPVDGFG